MALKPGIRSCRRVCAARAHYSYTRRGLLIVDKSCAGEALLSGYGKPDLIFYKIVGDMVP